MISASDVESMLVDFGQMVLLRRIGSPNVDVTVLAMISRDSREYPTPGSVAQFQREVVMSNTEIAAASWPGPPRKGDQVVAGGITMTVQAVDTATIGDEVVKHKLMMLGG